MKTEDKIRRDAELRRLTYARSVFTRMLRRKCDHDPEKIDQTGMITDLELWSCHGCGCSLWLHPVRP